MTPEARDFNHERFTKSTKVLILSARSEISDKITGLDDGAGLGLPLVRDIVEKHGGKIEIESTPGEGTEITVEFPV